MANATVIKYNGNIIHTLGAGEHITLPTSGKVMGGDIEIIEGVPVESPYLTFSSTTPFTLYSDRGVFVHSGVIEVSTDATNWVTYTRSTQLPAVESAGKYYVYARGSGNTQINDGLRTEALFNFDTTGTVDCEGNVMCLLDYAAPDTVQMGTAAFMALFRGAKALASAPSFPATSLSSRCYQQAFLGTGITAPPELPATVLADGCYNAMFHQCKNLERLPKLPAETLTTSCYQAMFYACSNIKLSATQTGIYQYPYRIPTSGTGATGTSSMDSMFGATGGTYTSNPVINTTYYTNNEPI